MNRIEELTMQIADLTQQLYDEERSQLVITNWELLISDLNNAGLSRIFAAIVAQALQTPNPPERMLEAEALELISVCRIASKKADRVGVIESYLALMALAQELASPELGALINGLLPSLQQVLDDRSIDKSVIAFVP